MLSTSLSRQKGLGDLGKVLLFYQGRNTLSGSSTSPSSRTFCTHQSSPNSSQDSQYTTNVLKEQTNHRKDMLQSTFIAGSYLSIQTRLNIWPLRRQLDFMYALDPSQMSNAFAYDRSLDGSLRSRQLNTNNVLGTCFWFSRAERSWHSKVFTQMGTKKFHSSCILPFSAGAAPDISFDSSVREEQLGSSATLSSQNVLGDRVLKLLSGSCYLPHPDKEDTGGEDAHFICENEQAIGVADGVGGWADSGINSGLYSRELMSNSLAAIKEEPKGSINPSRVLEKAHSKTSARGSSTACIIALTEQGIHAVNLGDSGFIVVREGCTIFRSPVQQHDFNFTYQLECGNSSDLPSSAQVFTFSVDAGDVIIAGTDGLFDNLYNNEITAVVVHAIRAGFNPQVTAQKIAALARQRAQDKNRQTPFSTAAQDAGYRYYGGKLDDITVLVSYITASNP